MAEERKLRHNLYIYKISQDVNKQWDTYDSAVVIAESEKRARMTYPHPGCKVGEWEGCSDMCWCSADQVKVELLGKAIEGKEEGLVVSSFNRG